MNFKLVFYIITALLVLASIPFTSAQQENTPGSGSDANVPVIVPDIPQQPPVPPPSPEDQQLAPDMIIISGRVVQEDGSPPPFGTIVERDCGGVVIKEQLVDSNGNFNFVVGDMHRASSLFPDATENFSTDSAVTGGTGVHSQRNQQRMLKRNYPEDMAVCVVQARYTGYQSTIARLGIGQTRGYMDVGTIVIYPLTRAKRTVVSTADLMIPDRARKDLEKGREAFADNEFDKAEKHYKSAIVKYPQYSDAWIELGWLYQEKDQYEQARNAYKEALNLDKSYVNPYLRLAQLSAMEEKWDETESYTREALELNATSFPQAYFLDALAKYNLNKLDSAEESVRKGINLDQENKFPKMQLVLANILAKKMDPYGSMRAMLRYLEVEPNASNADYIRLLVKKYEKITENLPESPSKE